MNITAAANAPVVRSTARKSAEKQQPQQPEKDWTVLLYMDGHNDLEPYVAQSLLSLEKAGGTDKNVNVVAELGRLPQDKLKALHDERGQEHKATGIDGDWSGVRRYLVKGASGEENKYGSKMIEDLGEQNMSKATTLADFLVYGVKNYPAKHYLVVLMDHGGGWRGAFTDDYTAEGTNIMEPDQITAALKMAHTATGKRIDNVDMAACLMASGEMAYEMRDTAKYLTASEEMGTTDAFDYGPVVGTLKEASEAGKPARPKELAQFLVGYYQDHPSAFVTKSAIDLDKIGDVKDALNDVSQALIKTNVPAEAVKSAVEEGQSMARTFPSEFYSQFRDLSGIAEGLAQLPDKNVKAGAKHLQETIDAAVVANLAHDYQRQEVIDEGISSDGKEKTTTIKVSQGHYDTHGISIFAPTDAKFTSDKIMNQYNELSLARETNWDEFFKGLNGPKNGKA